MYNKLLFALLLGLLSQTTFIQQAQGQNTAEGKHFKLGITYFSETIIYPGIALEVELEKMESGSYSLPQRINIGFYAHPRNHVGVFADIHQGFRHYLKSGWFLENSIGVGLMIPFYNEDVWEVDENGDILEASKFGGVDFMPSVTLGIGYCINKENKSLIAFRPKIFWQFPYNEKALPHTAFQLTYAQTF